MKSYKYDKNTILEKTNRGLDIIRACYPQQTINPGTNFSTHEEKNASSSLILSENTYLVKNHTHGKTMDPFHCIIETQPGISEFVDAIKWAAAEFNIVEGATSLGGAKLEFKDATPDQKNGAYYYDFKEELSDFELSVLGPIVTQDHADTFKLKSARSFTQIKTYSKDDPKQAKQYAKYGDTPQQIITTGSDSYPIFVFDYGTWQKIYEPLKVNKNFRFRYVGDTPKKFIFGVDSIPDLLRAHKERILDEVNAKADQSHQKTIHDIDDKLPGIIMGSGDRDSINIASMDHPVVWLTSESAKLSYSDYWMLMSYTDHLYYLGDIDAPGITEGIKMALTHTKMRVIWLPDEVKEVKYRGKPGKDLKDWVDITYRPNKDNPAKSASNLRDAFNKLVRFALPAEFWETYWCKKTKSYKYKFNTEAAFQFLWYNGFHTIAEESDKNPFSFVQIIDGTVVRKDKHEVANFLTEYTRKRREDRTLINYLNRSGNLSDTLLSRLPQATLQLKDSTRDSQLYFFENEIWKVTADSITRDAYGKCETQVWKDKIIPHKVKIDVRPVFKITEKDGVRDIKILRTDNHYFNFLINTSRVHWKVCGNDPFVKKRSELHDRPPSPERDKALTDLQTEYDDYHKKHAFCIDEPGLSPEQIQEQKDHLINKLFGIGYLLHKHRKNDETWIVLAMDDKVSEVGDANGGSGKSITFKTAIPQLLRNSKKIDASDPNKYKNDFLFQGVTKDTDYINLEDADAYFPWDQYKGKVDGDLDVNPKGTVAYTIPFEDAPKIGGSTNFGIYNMSTTLARRFLFYTCSDYYHFKIKEYFNPTHQPKKDFGKQLIADFDAVEMSAFFNVMAQMCQFFIQTDEKIDPPEGNLEKRNAIQTVGPVYYEWANNFFEDRKNIYVVRKEALDAYKETEGHITSQKFIKDLYTWCDIYGYNLNPKKSLNARGNLKNHHNGKTKEFIYIQSQGNPVKTFAEWAGSSDSKPLHEQTEEEAHAHFQKLDDNQLPDEL